MAKYRCSMTPGRSFSSPASSTSILMSSILIPPLMPKDPHLRGRGRVLVDYGLNYIHAPYWALRGEMLKKESERDSATVEEKQQTLRHLLQYLEEALGDKPYFLGEMSLT